MQISKPSTVQLRWQNAQLGLFCHFGVNTFHNREWSAGQLAPETFDPQHFDANQWTDFATRAGFKYLVLTAKHHDGFCLWPTETTEYSVKNSPRAIDIVGEVSHACREAGIGFGLYLSPWDRNAACYDDKPVYDRFYLQQMTELCARYGELFEIWLDGAGSEGRTYDWDAIMEVIDSHQPDAAVFNMGRPSIRWIGNEDGLAADPCYYAVSQTKVSAFTDASDAISDNKIYLPPECDVAVRRHWFWQTDDLQTLKTKEHLLGIWYRSIGRGANLLLNLGPNRDGLLDEHDTSRVLEVTEELKARFENSLAARVTEIDGGCELDFGKEVDFDHLILREEFSRGQRVDGYIVTDEKGNPVTSGQTIGHQKWHAFPKIKLHKLRIAWSEKTVEGATLQSAEAYRTGFETLPQVGEELDYGAWSEKADAREKDVERWSKS